MTSCRNKKTKENKKHEDDVSLVGMKGQSKKREKQGSKIHEGQDWEGFEGDEKRETKEERGERVGMNQTYLDFCCCAHRMLGQILYINPVNRTFANQKSVFSERKRRQKRNKTTR